MNIWPATFVPRRLVESPWHPDGAFVDDERPFRMIGNDALLLEQPSMRLAPHERVRVSLNTSRARKSSGQPHPPELTTQRSEIRGR